MSVKHQINRIFYSVNPRNVPDSLVLTVKNEDVTPLFSEKKPKPIKGLEGMYSLKRLSEMIWIIGHGFSQIITDYTLQSPQSFVDEGYVGM